jgi:hypothetical protein
MKLATPEAHAEDEVAPLFACGSLVPSFMHSSQYSVHAPSGSTCSLTSSTLILNPISVFRENVRDRHLKGKCKVVPVLN